jgi:hypothetical protein
VARPERHQFYLALAPRDFSACSAPAELDSLSANTPAKSGMRRQNVFRNRHRLGAVGHAELQPSRSIVDALPGMNPTIPHLTLASQNLAHMQRRHAPCFRVISGHVRDDLVGVGSPATRRLIIASTFSPL